MEDSGFRMAQLLLQQTGPAKIFKQLTTLWHKVAFRKGRDSNLGSRNDALLRYS